MTAKYWTYEEMWSALTRWQDEYPNFMEVVVIGQSRQGKDLPGVILTNRATGPHDSKSAVFVDANIHAGEVTTNAVAMHWIEWCLTQYGQSQEATELLDAHTAYIVPRIAVDGAELYLSTPARFRSSPHLYPFTEAPDGFIEDDVNGDGYILQMRVPAEDGGFAVDEVDGRVMRPRKPGEMGGPFYHVFTEGRIDVQAKTGVLPAWANARNARRHGMDFNRNFPIRWAGESGQPGAGPFPLSEPELRSLADFILAHPNIAAYVALHTSGGVILRQPSTGDDTVLSQTDRHLFTRVAQMGSEVSGYHAGSNYSIFATGHEKILMPGAADDWMYDHFGVLGFTVELWDLAKRAGARGYGEHGMRKMMALTPDERLEDLRKIVAWASEQGGPDAFFEWTWFHHPDFGPVEIGGLNPKFVIQNPPSHLLGEECENASAFLTRLGLCTPKLTIANVQASSEGPGVYRIVAEASNAGYLPTSSTEKGKGLLLEGLKATLDGPVQMLAGKSPESVGHLDGYGSASSYGPPKSQRAHVEWVVRAEAGTVVTVTFSGARAGSVQRQVTLG